VYAFSYNEFIEKMPFKTCFTTHFQINAIFSPYLTLDRSSFGSISEYKPEMLYIISLK